MNRRLAMTLRVLCHPFCSWSAAAISSMMSFVCTRHHRTHLMPLETCAFSTQRCVPTDSAPHAVVPTSHSAGASKGGGVNCVTASMHIGHPAVLGSGMA